MSHVNFESPLSSPGYTNGEVVELLQELRHDELEEGEEQRRALEQLQFKEHELLEKLKDIEEAFRLRKKPVQLELEMVRAEIVRKEMAIWQAENHGEEEVPTGPECLSFVNGTLFSSFCSLVIVANLAVMVLEFRAGDDVPQTYKTWDNLFLTWYVLELALKGAYLQRSLFFGHVSTVWWNWLDVAIVVSGILDQWLMPMLGSRGLEFNMSSLRCLRLLRLFRIARALKLVRIVLQSDLSWTDSPRFESFMMAVICINALVMWLELDFPGPAWQWVEHLLLAIYTFELVVRAAWHGREYFAHPVDWAWHCLDFIIVTFGVLEQWMMPLFLMVQTLVTGQESKGAGEAMHAVRLLRVMRVARVLRLARLLRNIKPLFKLINGVMASLQAIGWVVALTFLLLYSAAIVFTTLVGQGYIFEGKVPEEAADYFGSVFQTFLSLFKLMNDDQSVVAPIISTVGGQLLFYVFMMLSNWMMLAILTSVVSDNMMTASRTNDKLEEEAETARQIQHARRKMTAIFQEIDKDNTGSIDQDEMSTLLQDADLRAELCAASGLSPEDLVDVLHCVSYNTSTGERVLLYRQFLHMLQDEAETAKERSIFKIMEHMRAMEFRQEQRLNRALIQLGIPPEEVEGLPSSAHEVEKIRKLIDSPAKSLVRQLTNPPHTSLRDNGGV